MRPCAYALAMSLLLAASLAYGEEPAAIVRGRVENERGEPIRDAVVEMTAPIHVTSQETGRTVEGYRAFGKQTTKADGLFEFAVPEGFFPRLIFAAAHGDHEPGHAQVAVSTASTLTAVIRLRLNGCMRYADELETLEPERRRAKFRSDFKRGAWDIAMQPILGFPNFSRLAPTIREAAADEHWRAGLTEEEKRRLNLLFAYIASESEGDRAWIATWLKEAPGPFDIVDRADPARGVIADELPSKLEDSIPKIIAALSAPPNSQVEIKYDAADPNRALVKITNSVGGGYLRIERWHAVFQRRDGKWRNIFWRRLADVRNTVKL